MLRTLFLVIFFTSFSFAQKDSVVNYYDNGKIESIIHFKNNIRDGEAKFYWENGNLKRTCSYFNGKVDGLVTDYNKNGLIQEMYTLENGKREGPTSLFDSTGTYVKDVMYKEGKLDVEEKPITYSKFDKVLSGDEKSVSEKKKRKIVKRKIDPNQPLPPAIEDERNSGEDPAYYLSVEVMPEPIGGMKAIYKKITYPKKAKENGIEGTVIIRVLIEKDGEVKDAQVIKGIGYGCDEAARLAIFYHRFKPGLQRGKRVKVQMDIPVEFKLDKND